LPAADAQSIDHRPGLPSPTALANVGCSRQPPTFAGPSNELHFHTWGNENCCLPRAATSAHLYAIDATLKKAIRPPLEVEATSSWRKSWPENRQDGRRAIPPGRLCGLGASSTRRLPVPAAAGGLRDPLYLAELDPVTGGPKEAGPTAAAADTLPLVEVAWAAADALPFPLCLSLTLHDGTAVRRASLARGNIVVADHGRTVVEEHSFDPPYGGDRARLQLTLGPLTMTSNQPEQDPDVRRAGPAIRLTVGRSAARPPVTRPSLLDSGEFDADFITDTDSGGRANCGSATAITDSGCWTRDHHRHLPHRQRPGRQHRGEGLAHVVPPRPRERSRRHGADYCRAQSAARPGRHRSESIESPSPRSAAFRATQFAPLRRTTNAQR
jgi:hypothetical protein